MIRSSHQILPFVLRAPTAVQPTIARSPLAVAPAFAQDTVPPTATNDQLVALAKLHPEFAFPSGGDISLALNAHYSNRRGQLAFALAHSYNCIEGDVRLSNGVAVMTHDRGRASELTFAEWATTIAVSGRMLRIDLKESRALPEVIKTLRKLGIPGGRLQFNVSVIPPWESSHMNVKDIQSLRREYPDAWITFNVPAPLSAVFKVLGNAGHTVGGRIGVALQPPEASPGAIKQLHGLGLRINIWNDASKWAPQDVAAEKARLRDLGIDGMLDVRGSHDPLLRP